MDQLQKTLKDEKANRAAAASDLHRQVEQDYENLLQQVTELR